MKIMIIKIEYRSDFEQLLATRGGRVCKFALFFFSPVNQLKLVEKRSKYISAGMKKSCLRQAALLHSSTVTRHKFISNMHQLAGVWMNHKSDRGQKPPPCKACAVQPNIVKSTHFSRSYH